MLLSVITPSTCSLSKTSRPSRPSTACNTSKPASASVDCREQQALDIDVAASADVAADAVADRSPQTEESPMSKRVLTIDDSKTIRDIIDVFLRRTHDRH